LQTLFMIFVLRDLVFEILNFLLSFLLLLLCIIRPLTLLFFQFLESLFLFCYSFKLFCQLLLLDFVVTIVEKPFSHKVNWESWLCCINLSKGFSYNLRNIILFQVFHLFAIFHF
jgi:hypothetical protein